MFADEFPELSKPYESEFFSGDRHIIRKLKENEASGGETLQCEPAHVLKVNTMIGIKSDDVLNEAKSLLNGWIKNENLLASNATMFQDEYNYAESWIERANTKPKASKKDLTAVRQMILESIPDTIKDRVSHQNLAVALKVRHEMAKERRMIIEEQKALRKLQMETRKTKIKEQIVLPNRQNQEKLSKTQKNIASEIAKVELNTLKEEQACLAKEAVIEIKKAQLAQAQSAIQPNGENEIDIAKDTQLNDAYARADLMKLATDTQKSVLRMERFEFRHKTKRKYRHNENELETNESILESLDKPYKELELLAIQVRQEQQKIIKAIRHDRLRILSYALLQWKKWIALEKQEKLIKIAHERRALKMQQFLLELQNRHLHLSEELPLASSSKKSLEKVSPEVDLEKSNLKSAITKSDSQHEQELQNADIRNQQQIIHSAKSRMKKSQIKILKPSKSDQHLLIAMQEREKLRLERKAEIAKQKEERQRELQRIEMEKKLEKERLENEERERLIAERKRLEKETRALLLAKEREKQLFQAKFEKARKHCNRRLLKYYGMNQFKLFIHKQNNFINQASAKYDAFLLSRTFGILKNKLQQKEQDLEQKADKIYQMNLIKSSFSRIRMVLNRTQEQIQISSYLHAQRDLKNIYIRWKQRYKINLTARLKDMHQKNLIADTFAMRAVPRRYLGYWKQFVQSQKEARWREYRKSRLREAASEVLQQSRLSKLCSSESQNQLIKISND